MSFVFLGVRESGKPGEEGEPQHPRRGGHEHGVHAACFRSGCRRWRPVARHGADEARLTTGEGYRGEGREGGEVDGAVEEEAEPLHLQEMARRRVVATAATAADGQAGQLHGGFESRRRLTSPQLADPGIETRVVQ
jgi:hypothetical protein